MSEMPPPADRTEPPSAGDEHAVLDAWLDYHRRTLTWKCEGLTDDQLRSRPIPPSGLSLIGLVRHLAEVERSFFAGFLGLDRTRLYDTGGADGGDLDDVDTADVAADLATLEREAATYREAARDVDLDTVRTSPSGREFNLRWIYTHLIDEYARHNGHADLLREAIDGATGY